MTPTTDTSTTITRRHRHRTFTPQETLARLREDNPGADAAALREIARQYIVDNAAFEDQASRDFTLWLADKALLLEVKDPPDPSLSRARAERRAAIKQQTIETMAAQHQKLIEAEAHIRLLEYQTTYGKALGDCTGAECERLSRRYGDFFFELAKRITRSETVRAHLSEAELQAIGRSHRLIGEKAPR